MQRGIKKARRIKLLSFVFQSQNNQEDNDDYDFKREIILRCVVSLLIFFMINSST